MIAAWMLYSLAVGVLIAVAAVAAEQCCRLLRLPRRWVWLAAICAAVLLSGWALLQLRAAAQATSDAAPFRLPSASAPAEAPGLLAALAGEARALRAAGDALLKRSYVAAAAGAERVAGGTGVLAVWGVASVMAFLLLGFTLLRVSRARRGWARHRIGNVPVLLSEAFGPAVIGVFRPAVVVPRWLLYEPAERQQVIVAHEEEHRRAHDPAALIAAFLGVCLLPWHLALWWLVVRLRLAVELDCDDRILRRGVTPLSYGSLLLEIAGRTPARLFGVTALADSRIHLERRLLAMTDTNRKPGRTRALLAAAGAVLLAAAACGTEAPTGAAIEEMDVADAQKQAEQSGLIATKAESATPLFVVDGKVVTEAQARAVAPEDIASIEVLKDAAAVREYGDGARNGVIRMKKRMVDAEQASAVESAALARELQEPTHAAARKQAVAAAAVAEKVTRKAAAARKQAVVIARGRTVEGAKLAADKEKREVVVVKGRTVEGAKLERAATIELRKRQAEAAVDEQVVAGEQPPMRKQNPFVVIDGDVSQSVTLPTLAPEEIESVTVLKAEAAVQRYGARAAGGAIVITTKRGAKKQRTVPGAPPAQQTCGRGVAISLRP